MNALRQKIEVKDRQQKASKMRLPKDGDEDDLEEAEEEEKKESKKNSTMSSLLRGI